MAADHFLLSCQLRIAGLDEFKPYREHLAALRESYLLSLVAIKDVEILRQLQGRVQQLDDLLEEMAQAPALASKTNGV